MDESYWRVRANRVPCASEEGALHFAADSAFMIRQPHFTKLRFAAVHLWRIGERAEIGAADAFQ